jgi:branched-chain amino acid transport system permease protein
VSTSKFQEKKSKLYLYLIIAASLLLSIALPLIFKSDLLLSILCQIGVMIIFALSYNMILGQTGLLSFGHAVYFGLGAYSTIHLLNFISKSASIPVPLLPLAGGISGLLIAIVLGYITTKKAGTTFAMISMGIAEMVHACSLMFPSFFGGEGGISSNRVIGKPGLFGITYGPQIEFYFLILGWVLLTAILMYAISRTPLGRMANAVRDNPERAEFVGYNPQRVRYFMLILSGFFAGIAGGLNALNYEIVTAETVGSHMSGVVLLMTFVGGMGSFYGPIIGAALITFMQIFIGGVSKAWLFYLGLLFVMMVLFIPGGVASIINIQISLWQRDQFFRLVPKYLLALIPSLIALLGVIGLIEMSYVLLGNDTSTTDPLWKPLGLTIHVGEVIPWLISILFILVGGLAVKWLWSKKIAPSIADAQKSLEA